MKRLGLITLTVLFFIAVSPCFAQNNIEEQQKKFEEVIGKVEWKNISVDFYEVKDKAQNGYKPMTVKSTDDKNGMTYYVAKKSILSLQDTRAIEVSYNPGDGDNLRLVIRFNDEGKKTLSEYSTAHLNQTMGVVVDGKLRLVAHLLQPLNNGRVQVYGFNPEEAVGILKRYYQPKLEAARKFNQQLTAVPVAKKP
jgi:preprotein translocase subunit SecD